MHRRRGCWRGPGRVRNLRAAALHPEPLAAVLLQQPPVVVVGAAVRLTPRQILEMFLCQFHRLFTFPRVCAGHDRATHHAVFPPVCVVNGSGKAVVRPVFAVAKSNPGAASPALPIADEEFIIRENVGSDVAVFA